MEGAKIILLHHSTGGCIWKGGVPEWFEKHNAKNGTKYSIVEKCFPNESPYGWHNYPYDYWNIWVNNAGDKPYMEEPTLEILTKEYDMIIFKHCYPVSSIKQDTGKPSVNSPEKRIENYKLQYDALKEKLHSFPKNKFLIWTGAALVKNNTNEDDAKRAKEFFTWAKNDWDEKGDNVFIWDLWGIQTEGGIYFKDEYAKNPNDSHPNGDFSKKAAPMFCQRIVDIIEGRGDASSVTGK